MSQLHKITTRTWSWSIIACIFFFFVGVVVGKIWFFFFSPALLSPKLTQPPVSISHFPQIFIPQDWKIKEKLPGNSFQTAFFLNAGVQTQGTLSENNVIDYYFFILKDPSQVILNVTNVPKALYWVLYDSDYKEIASTYRTGALKGSTQIALQNLGKYYIRVWSDYHQLTNYPYTIRLSILPYFE